MVDFLGLTDGVLEYGVELRRAICAAVRRHRPEIVITNNFRDTWGGQTLNQANHIALRRATLDAVRDAGNRSVFHEQIEDGLEPWKGFGRCGLLASPEGKHAVETTKTFERGVASLAAHKAYIDGLGWECFGSPPNSWRAGRVTKPERGSGYRWRSPSRSSALASAARADVYCERSNQNTGSRAAVLEEEFFFLFILEGIIFIVVSSRATTKEGGSPSARSFRAERALR